MTVVRGVESRRAMIVTRRLGIVPLILCGSKQNHLPQDAKAAENSTGVVIPRERGSGSTRPSPARAVENGASVSRADLVVGEIETGRGPVAGSTAVGRRLHVV